MKFQDLCLLSSACIFIAAKALEQSRHLNIIVHSSYSLLMRYRSKENPSLEIPPMGKIVEKEWGKQILRNELFILTAVGFQC